MVGLIKNLKIKYIVQVKCLHCNNAGEDQAFKRTYKQEGLGVDFEYTVPDMQKQNGRIEWKFATLFKQVPDMLNGG